MPDFSLLEGKMPEEIYLVMIVHSMDDLPAFSGTLEDCQRLMKDLHYSEATLKEYDEEAIERVDRDIGTPPSGLQLYQVWPTLRAVEYFSLED